MSLGFRKVPQPVMALEREMLSEVERAQLTEPERQFFVLIWFLFRVVLLGLFYVVCIEKLSP